MSDPNTPEKPIMVNATSTSGEIEATVRQAIQLAGGVLLAYGVIDQQKWAAISALLPVVGSLFWSLWRVRRNHAKLLTVTASVPDSVAKVKE